VDRMSALDSWFVHVEDDVNHMHIGSIGVFEGPAPQITELEGAIGSAIESIPRYRQRFREVAGGLARPVWVADPRFRLDFHVRHTALPRPGSDAQLWRLVGRVMSQPLDRNRPLWETWFVEGLEGDRWAMISKVHHCVVDGIAGTDLLARILQPSPEPPVAGDAPGSSSTAAGAEDDAHGVTAAVRGVAGDLARTAGEVLTAATDVARHPIDSATRGVRALRGAAELADVLAPMPPSSLTGPIGPHRRYATARLSLDDAKTIKRALGGTVNDVALAAVATGYRELLAHRGELDAHSVVRTMVPVSRRRADERGELHNLVSAMFVALPVAADEPAERYRVVREAMAEMKRSGEDLATAGIVAASGLAPDVLVGVALRSVTRLLHRHQRFVTTVTTNVPGPQIPLYLAGRRLLDAYPYVPVAEGVRTGIAIFSYDGSLTFGVTADADEVPDLDVLTSGIEHGAEQLLALAR
jgi:diacylglycerol O-acyltransferase / wax synthase